MFTDTTVKRVDGCRHEALTRQSTSASHQPSTRQMASGTLSAISKNLLSLQRFITSEINGEQAAPGRLGCCWYVGAQSYWSRSSGMSDNCRVFVIYSPVCLGACKGDFVCGTSLSNQ